jgi:NTP pyrophosphatase (non-canonical NTP hydrolase)
MLFGIANNKVVMLALSLMEAQKLSAKIFRQINQKLDATRGKGWNPFVIVADILEEAGEVAGVVKGLEGYKSPDKPKTKEMLATELSDLLYGIFILAEYYNIDLEKKFLETVNDYILRFLW